MCIRDSLYASLSAAAEFCVDGKLKMRMKKEYGGATERSDCREHRPQWSAAAAVGAQWSITPALGVYFQPGIGYYFDNGSSTDNIYKAHPLNLDLNFGLRLTLGR